jgi:hypothetical protein
MTYMMDIEAHTIIYLRGLLGTCAIHDPEVVAFLSCWNYEEFFHSWALRQLMEAAGVRLEPDRIAHTLRQRSVRERVEGNISSALCRVIKEYQAVYFAWGAIQELTTLEAYRLLAARTEHPVLRELLTRIVKDERRHFSFYFNKALPHLNNILAQFLTSAILRHFWTPVGEGVKTDEEVRWVTRYLFGGIDGLEAAKRIDRTIAGLPGLEWFDLFCRRREDAVRDTDQASWMYLGHPSPDL